MTTDIVFGFAFVFVMCYVSDLVAKMLRRGTSPSIIDAGSLIIGAFISGLLLWLVRWALGMNAGHVVDRSFGIWVLALASGVLLYRLPRLIKKSHS